MLKNALNNVIDGMILEEYDPSEERCPFCGAPEEFIETYEIEDLEDDALDIEYPDGSGEEEDFEAEDEEGLQSTSIDPIEYHCIKCLSSWIVDEWGNDYLIDADPSIQDTKYVSGNIPSPVSVPIKVGTSNINQPSFEEKDDDITEKVKGRRVRKRARRRSSAKQRIRNLKSKRLKKRKLSQSKRLKKRVGKSRTKKVVFRDGKYLVVKKDFKGRVKKKKKRNENLSFDSVKKLDKIFEFDGRLTRLIKKSNNPSNFESRVSNFNKINDKPTFEEFIIYLNENDYKEDSNYLKTVKTLILEKKRNNMKFKDMNEENGTKDDVEEYADYLNAYLERLQNTRDSVKKGVSNPKRSSQVIKGIAKDLLDLAKDFKNIDAYIN